MASTHVTQLQEKILLYDPSSDGTDEDEEVEDCISQFLSHPFPNPINLSDEEAQRTSPFKLSYTSYLILNKKWESTKVRFDGRLQGCRNLSSEPLILTRLDGKKFPLIKSDSCFLFYVYYGDQGLELINVEKVLWKVPNCEAQNAMAKAKGEKKTIPEKVCGLHPGALNAGGYRTMQIYKGLSGAIEAWGISTVIAGKKFAETIFENQRRSGLWTNLSQRGLSVRNARRKYCWFCCLGTSLRITSGAYSQ